MFWGQREYTSSSQVKHDQRDFPTIFQASTVVSIMVNWSHLYIYNNVPIIP
jgi:hypothetical protein